MNVNAVVMERPGEFAQRELEIPDPGPGDVVLRVELAGICGTDVSMNKGKLDIDFPVVPGHEFAGTVEELGNEVGTDSGGLSIEEDDSLAVVPGMICGECWYCKNVPMRATTCQNRELFGLENVEKGFLGGMSERLVLPAEAFYYRLPDDVSTELGALVEPLAVAMRAFERALKPGFPQINEGFGVGQTVAVQGAGPVGLLAISVAKAAGAGEIIAIDPLEERLGLARSFGATETVSPAPDASDEELVEAVAKLTPANVGPDVVIEAAGVPAALRQSLKLPHDGGTVVEVGNYAPGGELTIDPSLLVRRDLDVYGSWGYPPSQFASAIEVLDQLREDVPFERLFNYRAGFDGVEDAFEAQASGEAFRATIHPDQ